VKLVPLKSFSEEPDSHVSDSETDASEDTDSSESSKENQVELSQEQNDAESSMRFPIYKSERFNVCVIR